MVVVVVGCRRSGSSNGSSISRSWRRSNCCCCRNGGGGGGGGSTRTDTTRNLANWPYFSISFIEMAFCITTNDWCMSHDVVQEPIRQFHGNSGIPNRRHWIPAASFYVAQDSPWHKILKREMISIKVDRRMNDLSGASIYQIFRATSARALFLTILQRKKKHQNPKTP